MPTIRSHRFTLQQLAVGHGVFHNIARLMLGQPQIPTSSARLSCMVAPIRRSMFTPLSGRTYTHAYRGHESPVDHGGADKHARRASTRAIRRHFWCVRAVTEQTMTHICAKGLSSSGPG